MTRSSAKLVVIMVFSQLCLVSFVRVHGQTAWTAQANEVRYDEKTGRAVALYNVNSPAYSGTAEQIARAFLREHRDLFKLKEDLGDLITKRVKMSPAGTHVGFIQTYHEIPVFGSETVVSINHENRVSMVVSGYRPGVALATLPQIDQAQALHLAMQSVNAQGLKERFIPKNELVVYPDTSDQFHLVWKTLFYPSGVTGGYFVLIDAQTGRVLTTQRSGVGYVNGTGKVFDPDPGTATNNYQLGDNNDADYPALQPAYDTVVLNDLNNADGSGLYRVQGRYASSQDLEYPIDEPVTTNNPANFTYNRSQPGFEEVNIYYFIDKERRYIGNLGFSPTWDYLGENCETIAFDARGSYYGQAKYEGGYMWFGVPTNAKDLGEDQSVIIHEYGHALHDAFLLGGTTGMVDTSAANGISEGIAEYLAISYRRSCQTAPYRPNDRSNWAMTGEVPSIREAASAYYPTFWTDNPYAKMKVWASTLMDMEYNVATNPAAGTRLGRDVTTTLQLASLHYLTMTNNVLDNVHAILQADRDVYGGLHLSVLSSVFYSRGFFYWGVAPSTISSNKTWSGYEYVSGNVTINSGVTLTISPNTFVFFASGTSLTCNGTLAANGTSSQGITFDRSGSSGTWNGIVFNAGSSGSLSYCTVRHATNGVYCASSSPTFQNSTFSNNGYGIFASSCSPLISTNTFEDNTTAGMYLDNASPHIAYNNIRRSPTGVYCTNHASPWFDHNTIENASSRGVYCQYYSSPYFATNGYYYGGGYNRIRNNTSDNLYAYQYSNPWLGDGSYGGQNSLYGSTRAISGWYSCTVRATNNWWGSASPNPNLFYAYQSTIYYTPCLSSDPNPTGAKIDAGSGMVPSDGKPTLVDSAFVLQMQGKVQEAIELYVQVVKSSADIHLQKLALVRLTNLFEQHERSGFLDLLHGDLAGAIAQAEALQVMALELEAYWKVQAGAFGDALTVLNELPAKFPSDHELEKFALFNTCMIYARDLGDEEKAMVVMGNLNSKLSAEELALDDLASVIATFARANHSATRLSGPKQPATKRAPIAEDPNQIALSEAYPNPFNPTTRINFALPSPGAVSLVVYDILGREIATLANGMYEAGYHHVVWDASAKASGIYYIRLAVIDEVGRVAFTKVNKLLLVR